MNFLITAIGSMSSECVISSLKKNNNIKIIGCDIYPKDWVATSVMVDRFYQIPKSLDSEIYINALIKIIRIESVDLIIPLTDPEVDVLSQNIDYFKSLNVIIATMNKNIVEVVRNKYNLFERLKDKINFIPTYECSGIDNNLGFPLIFKPKTGRSSEGIFKAFDLADKKYFLNKIVKENYIAQPLLEGRIITVDFIRSESSKHSFSVVREELLRTINGAGTTVEIIKNDEVSDICSSIGDELKINGTINFEFLEHEGKFLLMDINPRFSAGIAFSNLTGYDFVNNHVKCFIDKDIDDSIEYERKIIYKRYYEIEKY